MAASEMDDIRDIPGYKIILRAVLKSQIQHLVETLASQTDEESVIITASLSEGTSTHLGSESGKNFLQDHENVKTQFLGFCLKKLYKKNQEKEKEEKIKKKTFSQEQQSREANSFSSPKERVHTVRLTKASPVSRTPTLRHKPYTKPTTSRSSCKSPPGVHHEPYQSPQTRTSTNQTPPCTSQTSTSSPVTTHIKIEPFDFNLDQDDDDINKSVTSEPASPSGASVDPASTDNLEENCDISVNNHTSNLPSDTKTPSLDSDFNDLKSSELSVNPSTSSVQSSDVDRNVAVKIEAISECDMNLEITEVTSCQDTSSCQDIPNISFNTSGTAGNQTDIQGGKGNKRVSMTHICEICGNQFSTKSNLHRHMMRHTGDGKYTCCGIKFRDRSEYTRHHINKHGGEKNFQCGMCSKSFATNFYLKRHERCHTKDKFVKCVVCGQEFRDNSALHEHMPFHTREKKYSCSRCGLSFKFYSNLSRHMKIHLKKAKVQDDPI